MNNRRKLFIALGASALAWTGHPRAQPKPAKIARIGLLQPGLAASSQRNIEALREGLRDFGYVEGKNLVIEPRWADGNYERLNELAAELVRLKVDVIVTTGTPGTQAAKQATTSIPIIMASSGDPVAAGLVTSLARPGGNVTGSSMFSPEIHAKRLALLREVMPQIRRVAALINRGNPAFVTDLKELEHAARSLKLDLQQFDVRGPDAFDSAFSEMSKHRMDAVVVLDDAMLNANVKGTADTAARGRLPSAGNLAFADAGGLIGYGIDPVENYRRAAKFVDRILKGGKPGDLPIERATSFYLVMNMKIAKTLGITIPQSILLRADKVIE
jgi:putative ABC transport system substrate-binding protein